MILLDGRIVNHEVFVTDICIPVDNTRHYLEKQPYRRLTVRTRNVIRDREIGGDH